MNGDAYVFLDANILLHFHPPDQMDWPALCRAKRVNLVIYPLLMTEITKAKDEHPRRTIRDRAREREAWVRERLSRLETPVRPGVFLRRDTREPRPLARDLDLDWQHRDDRIIAHAVGYAREGRRTFVMTNDGGLELKLPDLTLRPCLPTSVCGWHPNPIRRSSGPTARRGSCAGSGIGCRGLPSAPPRRSPFPVRPGRSQRTTMSVASSRRHGTRICGLNRTDTATVTSPRSSSTISMRRSTHRNTRG